MMIMIIILAFIISAQFGWAVDKELLGITILFGAELILFALIMHNVQF
jgi:hypothetical protein